MLNKLIKYDFKSMFKNLMPLYLILIGFSILVRISGIAANHFSILKVPAGTLTILYIMLIFGSFIYTFIVSIKRFYTNILKDEGYLTNTLPVKKSNIVLSKILNSGIFLIITILIIILALIISYFPNQEVVNIFNGLKNSIESLGYNFIVVLLFMIVYLLLGYLNYIQIIYTSLAFGQMHNSNKIVDSFVSGLIIYTAAQTFNLITLGLFIVIFPDTIDMVNTNSVTPSFFTQIFLYGMILQIIYFVAYYVITTVVLNKKLNLE